MSLDAWLTFAAASFLVIVVPGPSVALIVHRSLLHGRVHGLISVFGTAIGSTLAFCLALMGVGALLMASALAFTLLKWAGGLYLVGLGLHTIWTAKPRSSAIEVRPMPCKAVFIEAFFVAAFNPKLILFFVAFAPLFLTQGEAHLPQFVTMVVTFEVIALLSDAVYAVLAGAFASYLRHERVKAWTQRFSGGVLACGGALLLSAKRA